MFIWNRPYGRPYAELEKSRTRHKKETPKKVPKESLVNGTFVSTGLADIAQDAIYAYSHTRRNHLSRIYNYGTPAGVVVTGPSGRSMFVTVPAGRQVSAGMNVDISNLATGATGWMRIHLYMSTDVDESLDLIAKTESGSAVESSVESLTDTWVSIDVPVGSSPDKYLRLAFYAHDADVVVEIKSVAVNETAIPLGISAVYTRTDGADNVLGTADYPCSTALERLLRKNAEACMLSRVSRAAVLSFGNWRPTQTATSSWSADSDRHGRWVIRKSAGILELDGLIRCQTELIDGDFKVSLYTMAGALVDSDTVATTAGVAADHAISLGGALDYAEAFYEIRVDSKADSSSTISTLFEIVIADSPLSASDVITTLPATGALASDRDVLAMGPKAIKDTLDQVWTRMPQTLLSDRVDLSFWSRPKIGGGGLGGAFGVGEHEGSILNVTPGVRDVVLLAHLRIPIRSTRWAISYAGGGAGGFTLGRVVTGATSGATGIARFDDMTNYILWLADVTGTFIHGENMSDGVVTEAASGVQYRGEMKSNIHAVLRHGAEDRDYYTDLSAMPDGAVFPTRTKIRVPSEDWNTFTGRELELEIWMGPHPYAGTDANQITQPLPHHMCIYEEIGFSVEAQD